MLFAGTGHGFFYSRDDGKTWTQFKDKLPAAPVNWIEVPKNAPEVAVATYGRGLWILRDVWQLEQEDSVDDQQAELQLFKPRPGDPHGRTAASATFVFSLTSAPTSPITVDVLGADGAVISTNQVQGKAGMNEAILEPAVSAARTRPVLRSIPPDNPHIWEQGRWEGRERPVDALGPRRAANWQPRAAPGKYTVRMTLNGKPVHAAVRGLARRDAAVHRRGPRREHRPAARHRDR